MVAAVRLLWVPLLLAPAGVVFVATETAIGPIASAERIDVAANFPATIELPTAAVGITTPERHVAVRVQTPRPVHRRIARQPKRVVRSPRPVYVVPRTAVVTHVVAATTTAPHASHTPKPKPAPNPVPEPTPAPAPAPAPPPTTTSEPTPPAQPPAPPVEPTPTPAAPPSPAPAPPAPTPAPSGGDGDDQGGATGDTRPGNGWGDPNHDHTGPPGHAGDHGRHGHD